MKPLLNTTHSIVTVIENQDEDSLRQQPSDPQSSLSSNSINEGEGGDANVTNVTGDTIAVGGSPINPIDEGPVTLGMDNGVHT